MITGFLGLFGFLGVIPAALKALFEAVGPLAKGLSELIVWFVKTLWEGFTDIIDNVATVVTVISLVAGFSFYYKYYGPERVACEAEIVKMQAQIKDLKAKASRGR